MTDYTPKGIHRLSRGFQSDKIPIFFEKAQGSYLYDSQDNVYLDLVMGKGSVTLGHSNQTVDNAAIDQIRLGSQFTLAPQQYYELSKKLSEQCPIENSSCIFSLNGSDAVNIAIRVSRAFQSKEYILFSGYHSWQDGFLNPKWTKEGIPKSLNDQKINFFYDLSKLEELIYQYKNNIAAILVTPEPGLISDSWFRQVRKLCDLNNIILISDEIKCGYHVDTFGYCQKINLIPDILLLSKGLANGYPLSAVIGKKNIMDASDRTIIFGTYFFNAISIATSLRVNEIYTEKNVVNLLREIGSNIKKELNFIFSEKNFPARVIGDSAMPFIVFESEELEHFFYEGLIENRIFCYPNDNIGLSTTLKALDIKKIKLACTEIINKNCYTKKQFNDLNLTNGIKRLLSRKMISHDLYSKEEIIRLSKG